MRIRSFKLNTTLNIVKQLCTVLFPLITIPYVTRTLQVTNYGKVNFSSSVISYFILLASFGMNNYVIREGGQIRTNNNEFSDFANEVFSINCITTFISYVVLIFLLLFSAKVKEYTLLILIQSIAIILNTLGANWINSIFEDYLFITVRYIVMQIIAFIGLFMFVHGPEDYIVYTIIHVLATAGGNLLNIFYIRKYAKLKIVKNINYKKHLVPLLLFFCNEVALTIYVNSDITILGVLKEEQDVGIYSLAVKIYTAVKTILNSIIVVSIPRLAFYLGEDQIDKYKQLCKKVFTSTLTLLFPAIVGMFFLSSELLLIISGEEYIAGSLSFKILSITLLFSVFVGFYGCCVLIPKRQEKICLIASFIGSMLNICLNFILIPYISYNGAALTTLLAEALVCVIYMFNCKKHIENVVEIRDLISVILGCCAIVVICCIGKKTIDDLYIRVILEISISVIAYFLFQILSGNSIVWQSLLAIIKKIKRR